jgi:hypothetical protein
MFHPVTLLLVPPQSRAGIARSIIRIAMHFAITLQPITSNMITKSSCRPVRVMRHIECDLAYGNIGRDTHDKSVAVPQGQQ